jgi:hypothetical protein
LNGLPSSDYAQAFHNRDVQPPLQDEWARLCIAPYDFDALIEDARGFAGFNSNGTESEQEPTRAAPPDSGHTTRKFSTQLSKVVDQILTAQCPGFLELTPEGEVWPKQEVVVPWLQDSLGLSEAEAKAVDAVTRPDSLRARGKRSGSLRPR